MRLPQLLPALLSLLVILARPSSAQTQQEQTQPLPAQAKPQAPPDYSKLKYQIPLVSERANETVVDLAFSPDSKVIAVLYTQSIGFWATSTGAPIGFATGTLEKFTALAFGSNSLVVTGGQDGGVAVWDWHDLSKPKLRTGDFSPITTIAFSPDGSLIVTAQRSDPPSVMVWDVNTGKKVRTMSGLTYAPTALQFTADGTQLLAAGGGLRSRTGEFEGDVPLYSTAGEFTRWNLKDGTLDKMVGVNDGSPDCAFSPDGTLLAWVGKGAAVSPNGNTLWLGTTVRVWRVPGQGENDNGSFMPNSLRREREAMVHNPGHPAVAFSPDQRVLAICEDYRITLWSGGAGQNNSLALSYPTPLYPWDWYGAYPYPSGALTFSPDGKMLAVGGCARAAIWKMAR